MVKNKLVKEIIKENNLDGVIIHNPSNTFYLTGFSSSNSYVLVTKKKNFYFTDSRYYSSAEIHFEKSDDFVPVLLDFMAFNSLLKSLNLNSIGVESDYLTVEKFNELNSKLFSNLLPINFSKIRMYKTPRELSMIKKSMELAEKVMDYLENNIEVGMTEKEVKSMATVEGARLGAEKNSFDFIVASGINGDTPHWNTSEKKIKPNELITIDLGFVLNGYCSDITRTFKTSDEIDPQLEKIYKTVLKANMEVTKNIVPGMKGKEVDAIARKIISKAGYENYFNHGLGHGLGVEIHEKPNFSQLDETIIEPGMVISNEPGIYIPSVGGVRIEDILVITKDGAVPINKISKKLRTIKNQN